MNVFTLMATLGLDKTKFESGLNEAKTQSTSIGSSIGKGLSTAVGIGVKAVTAAGTAMAAFGASSVKTGQTFDTSMSKVAATMGKTMQELESDVNTTTLSINGNTKEFTGTLRDFAQELGKSTAFSASQAADALNYMALAGYDAKTSMDMLPSVLNLAAAGGMELARASDMVTDTQSALGLSLDETSALVDKMAKASSKSNTSVEQLGDAMLTIGGTAKTLSGGTTELSTALGLLADNGIKGAEGGTALRNILLNLTPKSKEAADAMQKLGLNAYDSNGKLRPLKDVFNDLNKSMEGMTEQQKTNILSTIFNKVDLKSVNALMATNVERWDELTTAIDESQGAAEKMAATQLDNLNGDITIFKSALEGAQIAVSDKLTPALRDFVEFGTEGLSSITDAFLEGGLSGAMDAFGTVLSDALTMIIDTLPQFVDAGIQLIGALGQGIIDNIPQIVDAAVEIVLQLGAAIITAAPKLAEGAITLITSLGNALITNAPRIIEFALGIVTNIATGITNGLPQIKDKGFAVIDNIINGITNALPQLANGAVTIVTNLLNFIITNAPMILSAGIELIIHLVQGIISAIPSIYEALGTLINGMIDAFMSIDWLSYGSQVINLIGDGIMALIDLIPTYLKTIGESAVKLFKSIDWVALGKAVINLVKDGFVLLFEVLPKKLYEIGKKAWDKVKEIDWLGLGKKIITFIWDGFVAIGSKIWEKLVEIGKKAWDKFKEIDWFDLGKKVITFIVNGLVSLFTNIGNKLAEIGRNAWNSFKNIDWLGLGSNIIDGIVNGIKNGASRVVTEAKNLAKSAFNAAKEFLGIASPSKKFMWIGEMSDEGMVEGIDKSKDKVQAAIEDLIAMPSNISDMSLNVDGENEKASINGLGNVIINVYGAAGQDVRELADIVADKILDEKQRQRAWAY